MYYLLTIYFYYSLLSTYQMLHMIHLLVTTYYLLPTNCYLLPTTYYLLFATCYLLLATCHIQALDPCCGWLRLRADTIRLAIVHDPPAHPPHLHPRSCFRLVPRLLSSEMSNE